MTFAYVQGNTVQNGGGSTTTMSLSFPANVGVGNTVIVTFGASGLLITDTVTVTDNNGNVYTNAFPVMHNAADNYGIVAAYLAGVINGPKTITITISSVRTNLFAIVDEFSGTGPLDVPGVARTQTNPGLGTDAVTSGSMTTITNGDLVYCFGASINDTGFSAYGTGFTAGVQGVPNFCATEYLTQAVAGPIAGTWTDTLGNDETIVFALAFQPYTPPIIIPPPPPPPVATATATSVLTTITGIGSSLDIVGRVKRLIPNRWFSYVAPYRDAILGGLADNAAWCYFLIAYARAQSRLLSAYGIWLDIFAYDYLGFFLTRGGLEDNAFRALIQATILQERVTRKGMINAITTITGNPPFIFEPWNTFDTGAYSAPGGIHAGNQYGSMGYNVGQGGWGSMTLPAQTFVQIVRGFGSGVPSVGGYGNTTAGYGVGQMEYIGPNSELSGITDPIIYNVINKTKPTGSTVWVAFRIPIDVLTSESGLVLTDGSGNVLTSR